MTTKILTQLPLAKLVGGSEGKAEASPSAGLQDVMENAAEGRSKPWSKFRGRDEQRRIAMFWARVDKKEEDDCWLWLGGHNGRYGKLAVNGYGVRARRFSWMLKYGEIPSGQNVLHKCDNSMCVNPAHLFLGTQQNNIDDMMSKKRMGYRPSGEALIACWLTADEVTAMRSEFRAGSTIASIAKKYDVHPQNASNAIKGRTWKQLI